MMRSMNNNEHPYEAPTFEVVGTIHEITKASTAPNADTFKGKDGTAFYPGS